MNTMMRRAIHVIALCVLMSPWAGPAALAADRETSPKEAAVQNVKLGMAYLQSGQYQDAKDKLERALKQDPDNFQVHMGLALLWAQLDKPAEAEKAYKKAMRVSPDNPDVINAYAVFLCNNGKPDEALSQFDNVLKNKLYRTPWVVATNAAVCLRSVKRNEKAVAYLERAISLREDFADAVIQMADVQLALGKGAQSRQVIDRFLALPRKSADLLLIGVRAALADGDRAAADSYARLLRRDFPTAPQTLALPQILQGNPQAK